MSEEQDIILVDLAPMPGVRGVAVFSISNLREKSARIMSLRGPAGAEAISMFARGRQTWQVSCGVGFLLVKKTINSLAAIHLLDEKSNYCKYQKGGWNEKNLFQIRFFLYCFCWVPRWPVTP
jgi:hypothetical protein